MFLPQVTGEFGIVAFDPEQDVKPMENGRGAWVKLRGKAVDRRKDSNGQMVDVNPLFIDIVAFGPAAQNLAESIAVGDLILVHGVLEERHWKDGAGAAHSQLRIRADDVAVSTRLTCAKSERVMARENIDYVRQFATDVEAPAHEATEADPF